MGKEKDLIKGQKDDTAKQYTCELTLLATALSCENALLGPIVFVKGCLVTIFSVRESSVVSILDILASLPRFAPALNDQISALCSDGE